VTTLTLWPKGTAGATPTISDSGVGTAFSAVTIGSGASLTYSSSGGCRRPSGGNCLAYATVASAACLGSWGTTSGVNPSNTTAVQFMRMYLDPADFGTAGNTIMARGMDTGNTNQRWRWHHTTTHTLVFQRGDGTAIFTSSALTAGVRYRVEWSVVGTTTGAYRLQIFVGDSLTAAQDSGALTDNFAGTIQRIVWGQATAAANASGKLEGIGWSDAAALGPDTVSGIAVGAGTVTGAIAGHPIVHGAVVGAATVTGVAPGRAVVHGSAAGSAVVAGAVSSRIAVHGTVSGSAAVAGAVSGRVVVHGTSAGAVDVTGSISATGVAVGAVVGSATVTGSAAGVVQVVGSAAGTADVTGAVNGDPFEPSVSGEVIGSATVTGTLSAVIIHRARRRTGDPADRLVGAGTSRRTASATSRRGE
jgi:hypothetical protein